MTFQYPLASVIHFHRKHAKLSQQALADIAGVGKTVIFDIEHKKKGVAYIPDKLSIHACDSEFFES